jgi:hypothetical protein
MKIATEYPPNYQEIIASGLKPRGTTIFCWGDTIFNPSGQEIPKDIIVHEEVHSKQQGQFPQVWWTKYLYDKNFRLDQELEAYHTQLQWIKKEIPKAYKEALNEFAEHLSSPIYNLSISHYQASTLIRKYNK